MPPRHFDNWIEACVTTVEDGAATPEIFQRWAAISAVAGALGRRCWYDVGSWKCTANQFIILVGKPAVGKSIAMHLPYGNVFKALSCPIIDDKEILAEAERSYSRYIGMDAAPLRVEMDRITPERLAVNMCSISRQLTGIPNLVDSYWDASVSVVVSEFGTFMRRNDADLQTFMTDSWDAGNEYSYKTKTQGSYFVRGPCVNLLAGATPEQFVSCLPENATLQGIMSRLVPIYYDGDDIPLRAYYNTLSTTYIEALRKDLAQITELQGRFKMEDGLLEHINEYLEDVPLVPDPAMIGFNARKRSHLFKIALVISAAKSNDMVITIEDWEEAVDLLWIAEQQMPKALAGFNMSRVGKVTEELAGIVQLWYNSKDKPMPLPVFTMQALRRVSSPSELPSLIEAMVDSRMVRWTDGRSPTHLLPGHSAPAI